MQIPRFARNDKLHKKPSAYTRAFATGYRLRALLSKTPQPLLELTGCVPGFALSEPAGRVEGLSRDATPFRGIRYRPGAVGCLSRRQPGSENDGIVPPD